MYLAVIAIILLWEPVLERGSPLVFLSFFLDLGIASDYSEVGVTSLPSSCRLPSSVEASVPRRWLGSVVGSKKAALPTLTFLKTNVKWYLLPLVRYGDCPQHIGAAIASDTWDAGGRK
jgi:hypothetical protein